MDEEIEAKTDIIHRFDGLYQREEHVWGVEPSTGVAEALPFLIPGRVLDLGSGDGRNALYLAHQGFAVTAVDIAPTAIDNLTRYAAQAKLHDRVKGIAADVETYAPEGQFENVVSTFTLHFLRSEVFLSVLNRIMQATAQGGVNIIEDFTKNGPLYKPGGNGYWLESGELRNLYEARGWRILRYNEDLVSTKATDESGNPYQQESAAIVALKP